MGILDSTFKIKCSGRDLDDSDFFRKIERDGPFAVLYDNEFTFHEQPGRLSFEYDFTVSQNNNEVSSNNFELFIDSGNEIIYNQNEIFRISLTENNKVVSFISALNENEHGVNFNFYTYTEFMGNMNANL